ncbi:hypothetical protein [Bacillus sp. EAC]|uniref:hypothetical protein n=1 Tax=Bacillus sp. EAC TaxID=1978338 RepID=UPI000B43276A|nr:hypothetical protein [Bacillus sp. EAC]
MKDKELTRGQPITFRIPSDTSDQIIRQLQKLKESERRNFSSKIAEYVMNGVSDSFSRQRQTITIPLPKSLSKAQRDWLKHEHSEALLGSIVYQLLSNPIRTVSLLTSLNSSALEIEDALYLQDEVKNLEVEWESRDTHLQTNIEKKEDLVQVSPYVDDLDNFNWETADKSQLAATEETIEDDDMDSLLGDFLAQMNK